MNWQPIETAPKDGTIFIAYGSFEGGMEVYICSYGIIGTINTYDSLDETFFRWSGIDWCIEKPMYWIPFPKPPTL